MARRGTLTRMQMRWRVAGRLNAHLDAVVTGTGSTLVSVTDSLRYEPAGSFVGWYMYFPTGGLSGSEVRVTAFTQGTGFTVLPTLGAIPTTGLPYELHPKSVRVYNDALRSAEDWARMRDWVSVRDVSTLTWVTENYQYTLGGVLTLDLITDIEVEYFTNVYTSLIGPLVGPYPQWRVEQGETPMLIFDRNYMRQPTSGQALRVRGARRPFAMALDSDTCEIRPEPWVVEQALMELHESAITARDNAAHQPRADRALARAREESFGFRSPPPNAVWIWDDGR